MSISDKIQALETSRQAIATAIAQKGGTVAQGDGFSQFATEISNLPSGGSGNPLLKSIDVSDFTGTTFNQATSYITGVTIPSGVTIIGIRAFTNFVSMTSFTVPNGVTSLGQYAFQNCTALTSVSLPNTLTTIAAGAFSNCSSLSSVTVPNGVTSLGQYAFQNCTALTNANIGSGVTTIDEYTFDGCSHLTSVTLPSSLNRINNYAFQNCTAFVSVNIPDTTTYIGGSAFFGCYGLSSAIIGSGITYIGNAAFFNGNSLSKIVVKAVTPPTIVSNTFNNTNNCPIYVPAESVDTYKAASGWSTYASRIYPITQLATVDGNPVYNYDLGNTNATEILDVELAKMPAGTSLEIAEGITWAGGATAFSNYTNLTLPSTFTTFGDQNMLNGLTTVTSKATTPPSAERNQIGGSSLTAIYVPAASVDTYKAAGGWSDYADRIQAIPVE